MRVLVNKGVLPSTMLSNNKKRLDLVNMLCRICAKEESNTIPIFGDAGRKQNIVKKVQACLPINIYETDNLPKQICMTCLSKLDSFWNMYVSCKEAQIKIEKKLNSLNTTEDMEQCLIDPPIETRLRNLSESYPISYGDSAEIRLAPEPTPPPPPAPGAVIRDTQGLPQARPAEGMMAPVTYMIPAPAAPAVSAPTPPTATEEVYPQALVQVPQNSAGEQPVVYQNCSGPAAAQALPSVPKRRATTVPAPKPMVSPASTTTITQRSKPTSIKRQNGENSNEQNAKKECQYCHKFFTDDIIDHHVSLHMRKSFSTCIICNKNFISKETLDRHRCRDKTDDETIDLDADDDDLIML